MMAIAGIVSPSTRPSPGQLPGLLRPHATKPRAHRREGRVRLMDPLLVITNSEAGPADDEALERALAVLRAECSVEVHAPSRPGELDGVLHRAGSRTIVVAG